MVEETIEVIVTIAIVSPVGLVGGVRSGTSDGLEASSPPCWLLAQSQKTIHTGPSPTTTGASVGKLLKVSVPIFAMTVSGARFC